MPDLEGSFQILGRLLLSHHCHHNAVGLWKLRKQIVSRKGKAQEARETFPKGSR